MKNYKLITNNLEFDNMLIDIKDYSEMSLDTENNENSSNFNTLFSEIAGFSLSVDGINGYYVVINHKDIKTDLWKRFKEVIINKKLLIFHNSLYDIGIFKNQYNTDLEDFNIFDTMVAEHLLHEGKKHSKSLKHLSKYYFNYEQIKFDKIARDVNYNCTLLNSYQIKDYAIDDAVYTFKLYKIQKEKLEKENLINLMILEMKFTKVLLNSKINGFTFDVDKCYKIKKELELNIKKLKSDIINSTSEIKTYKDILGNKITDFNFSSSQQLSDLLYNKLGLPIKEYTKKNKPSVGFDALNQIKNNHPIINILLEYKNNEKLLSSYTQTLIDKTHNGKIYSDFNQIGTESGRLSCSSPNLQQLPNPNKDVFGIRSLFKASEGYKLYVVDYSQQELKIACHITKSSVLKDVFEKNQDLHLVTANNIFKLNIPKESLVITHKDYNKYKEKYDKERKQSKFINFGILYGLEGSGLSKLINLSEEESSKIIKSYYKSNIDIYNSIQETKKKINEFGFITNIFGRRRRFTKINGRYYSNKIYKVGFNFLIQGSCADILRKAVVECYRYIRKNNIDAKIISTVHDEIIFEINKNENLNKFKKYIDYIMCNIVKLDIPLEVEGKFGNNYLNAK